jgi:hypothetical protein
MRGLPPTRGLDVRQNSDGLMATTSLTVIGEEQTKFVHEGIRY